jgi:hypothetical protein
MNFILYTAGAHGRFLKFLFDCYEHGEILKTPFNKNGNSHKHNMLYSDHVEKTSAFEVCHGEQYQTWKKMSNEDEKSYIILWQGLENFYYVMQSFIDRGGTLKEAGIETLENNLMQYESTYGTEVYITKVLEEHFNFDCKKLGQPPKGLLRNYFLFSFFTYFKNICWIKNEELSKLAREEHEIIKLEQILDYNSLQQFLFKIFDKKLNFKDIHEEFLNNNTPLKQLHKVKNILNAIDKGENLEISGLNVISEAYILFVLECKHFDIPFLLGDKFFDNTMQFSNYIKYFPNSMKKANNLFHKYYKYFQRQGNST